MANIPKNKPGRKKGAPAEKKARFTEDELAEISEFAAEGNTLEDISDLMGMSANAISSDADGKRAYELGLAEMRTSLRRWQFQAAKSGNVTMLIWLGKVILGQKEETQTTIKLDREDDELTKSLLGLAKEMDKSHGK